MNPTERKSAISLALLMTFRMLGLFMILPVFSLYAHSLKNVTPHLIGLALGIYGLTQACLQIPFGMLSDKIGRKPVILIGLLIFAFGSAIAALSHSITGVIIGRALQGGGAVGSVIIALLADSTKDENRTKAMAIIGMTIGVAFALAMVLGPTLNTWIGVRGIFWLTGILALIGIIVLFAAVPTPNNNAFHADAEPVPALFKKILTNGELLRLDIGIFIQHGILTATFIVIPLALTHYAGVKEAHQWMVYLPVLVIAYILMVPFIIIAEKKRKIKPIFIGCIATIAISQVVLFFFHGAVFSFMLALLLFFTAFTLLEATLPSLVSKLAPAGSKGTAVGVYSTSQFLGIFAGGAFGGWIFGVAGITGVFITCAIAAAIWFLIALTMKKPPHLATKLLSLSQFEGQAKADIKNQLLQTAGVHEVFIDANSVHLKVDSQVYKD